MSYKTIPTPNFAKSLKTLAKRHKSIKEDMKKFRASLEENPFQGSDLGSGLRKIRMAIESKGGGKSGGARVITFTTFTNQTTGKVYMIEVYDKSEYSTVKKDVINPSFREFCTINSSNC